MIRSFLICTVLLLSICSCINKVNKAVPVKIRISDSTFRVEEREAAGFIKLFDSFYQYKDGKFFIKSHRFDEKNKDSNSSLTEIYIEIPLLDSNTFKSMGQYLKDRSRVLCVFDNSDGGNYLDVKNADPRSFSSFKNVFGGKDSSHVFFQNKMLPGLDSRHVKVYSKDLNCSNCEGYFKDSNVVYFGSKRVLEPGFEIPKEYGYIE